MLPTQQTPCLPAVPETVLHRQFSSYWSVWEILFQQLVDWCCACNIRRDNEKGFMTLEIDVLSCDAE